MGKNIKVITHVREFSTTYPEFIYKLYFKIANKYTSDFIFCTGLIPTQNCIEKIEFKNYSVIHNTSSFDNDRFRCSTLHSKKIILGFVGGSTYLKGIDRLKIISEECDILSENIEIHVAGKFINNDITDQLKKIPNIKFLGIIDDMESFYKNIDCLLMVSRTETFPRVIIEAFNMSLPVIATNVGGVSEALMFGGGTLLENDDEIIRKNIKCCVKDFLNRYEFYSKCSYESYLHHFHPNIIEKKINDAIN